MNVRIILYRSTFVLHSHSFFLTSQCIFYRTDWQYKIFITIIFGFNKCPYQLLCSYKRRLDWNVAPCSRLNTNSFGPQPPWMQERASMDKSPTLFRHSRMNQAMSEKERQEKQRLIERKAVQQNKNFMRNWIRPTYYAFHRPRYHAFR